MASSNKHWPSMFKRSKPSNPHHNDMINSSLMSTGFQRTPYTPGGDERSPDPKPRWNPKPEQISILEAIFNSGMVNPPRDEIRKIRTQLQEYGQVGDANVFYWFQNRKSRSKHKLRHLQKNNAQQNYPSQIPQITPPSSSSSSSDKSSPQQIITLPNNNHKAFSNVNNNIGLPMPNSPTASVNQTYFQTHTNETGFQLTPAAPETFPFPMLQLQHINGHGGVANNANITQQGLYLSHEFYNMIQPQQNVVPCNTMSMNNLMQHQDPQLGFSLTSTSTDPTPVPHATVPPHTTQLIQGVGEVADGTAKNIIVFINDVAFEVAVGPFNVREAFGDGAVLFHSSGQPVLTDDWGVTLHSLHHAASYILITWSI